MHNLPFNLKMDDHEIQNKLVSANNRIGELNGTIRLLPNPSIILNAIILGEAKESSEIENIVTTFDEIYKQISLDKMTTNIKEVVNYRGAMNYGFSQISSRGILTVNDIIQIHHIIEPDQGDLRKLPGTVIKNTKTGEILHTPPQNEEEIKNYLANLEKYYNDSTMESIDPLIKMGLIHYQFESIHPFYDGNGRTGRIINILYLVSTNKIRQPVLYLSKYINQNREKYYKYLNEIQKNQNNFKNYILFMLQGIEEMCDFTIKFIENFKASLDNANELLKLKCPKIFRPDLIPYLFSDFYTKNVLFRKKMNVSRNTASSMLKTLEEKGFLISEKVGKEIIYKNAFLFNLIKEW